MKSRRYISFKKNAGIENTFILLWNKIVKCSSLYQKENYITKDINDFFEELPQIQNLLTDFNNISNNIIDYSSYLQNSAEFMNSKNIYDCFHGVINFIYYNSGNKFNIEELEFHYSGSQFRESLASIQEKQHNNYLNHYDIMNIFDYQNVNSQFEISPYKNAFFGLTFKRIKINPVSYSIRSGTFSNLSSHLISFTFEGYNEEENKWDILDERNNINGLIDTGSFQMFFVKKTDKTYSSFKIKQTAPGSYDFWGFSICAFEIHGIITYRGNINNQFNNSLTIENIIDDVHTDDDHNTIEYDPYINMIEFL